MAERDVTSQSKIGLLSGLKLLLLYLAGGDTVIVGPCNTKHSKPLGDPYLPVVPLIPDLLLASSLPACQLRVLGR